MCQLKAHIKLITTAIKSSRLFFWGVAVCLTLPLFGCASKQELRQTSMMENSKDTAMNPVIWQKMSDEEKVSYARKSLEDVGENPDARVSDGVTRAMLMLQGLEAVYAK